MTSKKVIDALKGTTFGDFFDLPNEIPEPVKPAFKDEESFNEAVVPIALSVLYDIMMDPTEKAYTKIEAARELLNRARGKPGIRESNGGIVDPEELTAALPTIVQRPKETPKPVEPTE